jgi:hypothetical protein
VFLFIPKDKNCSGIYPVTIHLQDDN